MIDRSTNPYTIVLNVDVPFNEDSKEYHLLMHELNEITDRYIRQAISSSTIFELKRDLTCLLHREEYQGVLISNNDFFEPMSWSFSYLLQMYEKHFPDRFEEKEQYNNMEVNNMLFDLNTIGIIGKYDSPAVCFDLPFHNEKVFDGSNIRVEEPIISLGDREMYKFKKMLNDVDLDLRKEL